LYAEAQPMRSRVAVDRWAEAAYLLRRCFFTETVFDNVRRNFEYSTAMAWFFKLAVDVVDLVDGVGMVCWCLRCVVTGGDMWSIAQQVGHPVGVSGTGVARGQLS